MDTINTMVNNAINYSTYYINLYGPNNQKITETVFGVCGSYARYQQVAEFAEEMGWDADLIDGNTGEVLAHTEEWD